MKKILATKINKDHLQIHLMRFQYLEEDLIKILNKY
jgi:hypothetical protein